MAKKYRASKFKAVKALTHTPPYKIHRYFARRPWNLFEELIRYYSEPGQVILDPFAGGGVTAYEGLKNNRKVVACDINPLSNYIVKNMYFTGDVTKLDNAVNLVIAFARQISKPTFEVKCPHCALATQAGWYELAHVVECTDCASEVLLVESAKVRNGVYRCSNNACWNSKRGFAVARAKRNTPAYLSIHGRCENCKEKFGIKIDSSSIDLNRENTAKLKKNVIANGLELADEVVPMDWDRQKEDLLFEKGIITFQDLFTKKNLYTNYLLLGKIKEFSSDNETYQALRFVFSDSLRDTNIMTFTNDSWQNGTPTSWAKHAYWLPAQFCEVNVAYAYKKSYESFRKCILFNNEQKIQANVAKKFSNIGKNSNLYLKTGTLKDLKLPSNSVDAVITDPPYGSNVQYLELSHFWYMWNKDLYESEKIDSQKEAVVNRKASIKNAKTYKTYEDNLYEVFSESNRVVKNGGHIVMTFNNKDMNSWLALLISIFRAGFHFEQGGITFQDGVSNYRHTAHTKAKGSPYGDFVYEFIKLGRQQYHPITSDDRTRLADHILAQITLAISKYEKGLERNQILIELFNDIVPEIEQFVQGSPDKGYVHDLYTIFSKADLEPLYA